MHVPPPLNGWTVSKRMLWLAWQACDGPLGSGFLQNKPDATEEDVWKNVHTGIAGGDYTNNPSDVVHPTDTTSGKVYADYVFGRMMKFSVFYDESNVLFEGNGPPRKDYQSWCGKYPTYLSLFEDAVKSLQNETALNRP